jgi:short-subunit dehydrogenase
MKIIVITGASEGIGAEVARQLASAHRSALGLVLAARRLDALEKVAAQCQAFGAQTLCVKTDVGVRSDCEALIAQTLSKFGRIDALINNAGISAQALLEEVPSDKLSWYEDLMRINHWGSVWCTHAALGEIMKSQGRIVAVSSLAGLVGLPGRTAYSASKFAMTGFFEALRAEMKVHGVSVTTAYPGVVLTEIRSNGLNAQGEKAGKSGLKEDDAMTVQECAQLIVAGMNAGAREVVMTSKGKLGRWLKLLAPGVVEKMALNVLKDDVKPKA